MNRSNRFDVDAYGDPPRSVTGCSLFPLMLIVGLAAFVYFTFISGAYRRRDPPSGSDRPASTERESPGIPGNTRIGENLPNTDNDDWSIEEVETTSRNSATSGLLNENLPSVDDPADTRNDPDQRAAADRTDLGDWSIEEVGSKRPDPAKPKSTTKGDWELEEVAE